MEYALLVSMPILIVFICNYLYPENKFAFQQAKLNNGMLFGICVFGPILEELIYRGILPFILGWCGFTKSVTIIMASIIFSLSHSQQYELFEPSSKWNHKLCGTLNFFILFTISRIYFNIDNLFISSICHILNNTTTMFLKKWLTQREWDTIESKWRQDCALLAEKYNAEEFKKQLEDQISGKLFDQN